MQKTLISNGTLITGDSFLVNHSILVENGIIQDILPSGQSVSGAHEIDARGKYVIPGMIDLQINGGGGAFFTKDPSVETIETIFQAHLEYGTTGFLPTVISTSMENILTCIEVTREYMKSGKSGVVGMHLEGPFFNPIRKGAHFEKFIHKPTDEEIQLIASKGAGIIKLLTLAPEMVTEKQIKMLIEAGIQVSAGHSDATYAEAMKGFEAGITKVTHLYNAMSQFTSRNPGLVGAFFDNKKVWGAIIVDGVHCNYACVRVAHTIKQGKLFLVSDASFIKHPVHSFEFDGFKIHFEDGKYLTETGNLAGSSISMLEGMQNCVRHAGIGLEEAVKMTSTYPAEFLKLENVGKIKKGYQADLLILDSELEMDQVLIKGELQTIDQLS